MLDGENGRKRPFAPEGCKTLGVVTGERRIGQDEVKGVAVEAGGHPERVALLHQRAFLGVKRGDVLAQRREGWRIQLDEGGVRSPTRQRLQPERTAAGEEVENASARKLAAEDLKPRFPHAFGSRSHARILRHGEAASTPGSAHDSCHAQPGGESATSRACSVLRPL